jgi:ubiquinone/menaquinone biosynthesis C-methylase UbiE
MQATKRRWRFKGPEMEGAVARWYAGLRRSGNQIEEYARQAVQLTKGLPEGAAVLEVAPGPGYQAIEIARLGFRVTGLDISHTFVQIAGDNARQAGVSVDFQQGDVAVMPFAAESFDLVICQAAFKNFVQPGSALHEMYRILRTGGSAVIQDMSSEATHADIEQAVKDMQLGWLSTFTTQATLEMLKRRAYTPITFEGLVAASPFGGGEILAEGMSLTVRLEK